MVKSLLKIFLSKIRRFIADKNNRELESKKFIEEIINKVSLKNDNYLKDGFKVYSQNDEDGLIESIFEDIGIKNRFFIEIGIGNGVENNTHYLLLKDWKGVWIDSNAAVIKKLKKQINNYDSLNLKCAKITPQNINQTINEYRKAKNNENFVIPENLDFLSIDIDSFDIFCIKELNIIKPRLICIEYNAKFPPPTKLSIEQSKNFLWKYDDYFGSSLSFLVEEMEKKQYKLISTNISGSNAFFTKSDLYPLCKTNGQSIKNIYMPPNYNLYDYNVTHNPTNKFLINKLKK